MAKVCIRSISDFLEVNFSNGELVRSKVPKITLYTKRKDRSKRKKILVSCSRYTFS